MPHPADLISSVKLAWAVAWSAFWTGFPFKLIVALLLLAAQVEPWEGAGLIALLALSVPIDIWAVGLTARTVFLERLSVEVRGPVGLSLWWQVEGDHGGLTFPLCDEETRKKMPPQK